MKSSELSIYAVTLRGKIYQGKYLVNVSKRFKGLALNIHDAMELALERAFSDNWQEVEIEELSSIGEVSFAPWLMEPDKFPEGEELDRQNRQFEITEDPQ
jgi:hypothetical protein